MEFQHFDRMYVQEMHSMMENQINCWSVQVSYLTFFLSHPTFNYIRPLFRFPRMSLFSATT